jgi:hypothetical protein
VSSVSGVCILQTNKLKFTIRRIYEKTSFTSIGRNRTGSFQQNKLTLRFQSASEESELDSVTPHTATAITAIRDITGIIPVAIITTTVGTRITEHTITMGRRTTGSIVTIVTIIIITAKKADGLA